MGRWAGGLVGRWAGQAESEVVPFESYGKTYHAMRQFRYRDDMGES